jgi:preprotein translocase subunit SecD
VNRTFRWRLTSVIGLILILGYLAAANFVPKAERLESPLWPDEGLRLGLDLQGGIHWVVGVDLKAADQHELEFMRAALETDAEAKNIAVEGFYVRDGELVAEFRDPAAETALRELAEDTNVLDETQASGTSLHWQLSRDRRQTIKEQTMAQVLEVLRRRIDDPVRGIPDSVVTRQGDDRVLVEIPGGQIDRARARALLRSTGFLEFKIVIDEGPSEEILRASYPGGLEEGQEIVLEKDRETDQVLTAYLVREEADITGDYLDDARVGFDPQQRPLVNFVFSPDGGLRFRDITRDNLKKKLAIILDDNVYSAPVIQGQISTRGQISGRFSSQEAADLAVVLRAGSLSVPVVIEEERSVGPALGQDSIDQGTRAAALGMLLTLGFAIGYYRLSGGYAAFALLVNLVLLVGLMSAFEATLTLPGIAGLVLTIGMAVDANVIIFERIREELRDGRSPRAAISAGFKKATWTVLDANITTLITAIILFEFGTGPIKGFAVTLSVGIITSVFSALVVTRMLFHLHPGLKPVERLSI